MKNELLAGKNVYVWNLLKYKGKIIGEILSGDCFIGNLLYVRAWLVETDAESEKDEKEIIELFEEVCCVNLEEPVIRPVELKLNKYICRVFLEIVSQINEIIGLIKNKKDFSRSELEFLLDEIESFDVVVARN